jgi:hypothetical protein
MSTNMADSNAAAREAEELEDQLDAALLKPARVEQANEEAVPFEIVRRLSDGAVPVTVWREYRGLSPEELAAAAHVPGELLGRSNTARKMCRCARCMRSRALRVDLDDLVPWSQDGERVAQTG